MSLLRPIRLAVYFDQKILNGGGFQQALNAALLIKELPNTLVCPVFYVKHKESLETLGAHGIQSIFLEQSYLSRIFTKIRRGIRSELFLRLIKKIFGPNGFEKGFIRNGIDLVYFVSPSPEAADLDELNYLITIWDLSFREDVEFPEIRSYRAFENRECLFRDILPKAMAIIADSEMGKRNLSKYYGLDSERIIVLPYMPAQGVMVDPSLHEKKYFDVATIYDLDVPYIFYPAQFWAHKNHVYILHGLKILESSYGHTVGAIFSGGDKGNLGRIKKLAQELGLIDRIRFVGFVENNIVPYLYKQALALVMPTYFGPTNLPPYEAFVLGVPVLYSNKSGLRDQVEDAALLMDLADPTSMAKHLVSLIENEKISYNLFLSGNALLKRIKDFDRLESLKKMLELFRCRLVTWS
ncbi:glycosyltransferase [Polynucleobacter sp. AP-Kaivos-20-H2]|uniref:glycosyltransferase n=1 Tax=Polynucleobacter sp. AP-Kaivos-20-H2 TaxID=2689104 RepID=UPI001C0CD58A|nr:glycosyltransferase [Polynucleobacter sp. AP-Kaivos-20-H2]MBU3604122.1 glycosyltransferase [Polynucleobacter sp. AP-Kaivos-20-H2]